MKTKFFTLCFAVLASIGTLFAETSNEPLTEPTEAPAAPTQPENHVFWNENSSETCAEVYSIKEGTEVNLNDVIVTYSNGKNVWIKDETASLLLYLPSNTTWKAGDVLSGVTGLVEIITGGIYELMLSADQIDAVTVTASEAPAPEELFTVEWTDINKYAFVNVKFTEDAKFTEGTSSSITIKIGEQNIILRNNFKKGFEFKSGKEYDIVSIVSCYNNNPQLHFISAIEIIERVQIGDLYYNLHTINKTAEVTSELSGPQYWSTELTTANIPASVTYNAEIYTVVGIGNAAFSDCYSLTSVNIPNTITTIGNMAFYYCFDLASVNIPNSVTRIGNNAFSGCYSLLSVTIPNSATKIEDNAFHDVPNIVYGGSATGSPWEARSVNGYVEGYFVYNNDSKTELLACSAAAQDEITIPNSVTNISNKAFYYCQLITSVVIPNSVINIGDNAFSSCIHLATATIGDGVKSIGSNAFSNCFSLISVTIPDGVTKIGSYAFNQVPNIVYYGSAVGSPWGARSINGYVDGYLVYSDESKSKLVACSASATDEIIIPNSVTIIGDDAFKTCLWLTSVNIPNSVTRIGNNAFYNCNSLTSVNIPNSVISIGDYAFTACARLNSLTIGDGVISIGKYAFNMCGNLTYVALNSNAIISKNYTSSSSLKNIFGLQVKEYIIGESVICIGNYAFSGCTGLSEVTIPNSVTSIGEGAFEGCTNLPIINNLRYADTYLIEAIDKTLSSYSIKEGTRWIGHNAFLDCINLTSITIPNSVIRVGNYSFARCSSLTSVEIPNSVTRIGDDAFHWCGLTSIEIPNSVTSIGQRAFNYCNKLKSVKIGNSVVSIGGATFEFCQNLISVELPNSITSIESSTFRFCYKLSSVVIPNSVISIGDDAFMDCSSLRSVEIPNSVINIGNYAFSGCTSLTSVTISNSATSIGNYAFARCNNLSSVTSPASFFEQNWVRDIISLQSVRITSGELTENVASTLSLAYKTLISLDIADVSNTELEDEAFKGYYNLQTLILPSNLTTIGYMSVADCKNLQSISIPASVIEIGTSAFEDCRSLAKIEFAEGSQLQTIGDWAFYNCHELAQLAIPEGVTEIGKAAFYGCTYLADVKLPASVQTLGDNAFALCSKMKRMDVDALLPPTIAAKTFEDVSRQMPVYVPDESVDLYKADALWGEMNIIGKHESPMGIDNTSVDTKATKILRDGQILILRGDKTYTLTGQRVE